MGQIVEIDNVIDKVEKRISRELGSGMLEKFRALLWYLYRWEWRGERGSTTTTIYADRADYSIGFLHRHNEHEDWVMNGGVIYSESSNDWGIHT